MHIYIYYTVILHSALPTTVEQDMGFQCEKDQLLALLLHLLHLT